MSKLRDYYAEIDTVLRSYEDHKPYHDKTVEWAADRIDWCWHWRKITETQLEELAERVTRLFEEEF